MKEDVAEEEPRAHMSVKDPEMESPGTLCAYEPL